MVSSGAGSPCLYAAGSIEVSGGVHEALRSEVAVVEEDGSVTADSYLSALKLPDTMAGKTITCIIGAGHTVHYDAASAANSYLDRQTYRLSGGGYLKPYYP